MVRHVSERPDCMSMSDYDPSDPAQNLPFAKLIGTRITHLSPNRVEAELAVTEQLGNPNGVLHGGVLMAMADNLGGRATMVSLPPGGRTSTIESKTNFFAPIPIGDVARAECTPLHKGKTTMVWQTRIIRGDGKLAAMVTQTQIVILPKSA
jgi:1,4-dihydroxy-2-naphthoyl-CoA hydrolase